MPQLHTRRTAADMPSHTVRSSDARQELGLSPLRERIDGVTPRCSKGDRDEALAPRDGSGGRFRRARQSCLGRL